MKPRKTWLHTAVRAHQAQTQDHQQRTARARELLDGASLRQQQSAQALHALAEAWAELRGKAQLDPGLDAAYQRFHGHLQHRDNDASAARQEAQASFDAAADRLKTSHGTQRVLERMATQAAERQAREARTREQQANAEAWLLGQLAKEASQ